MDKDNKNISEYVGELMKSDAGINKDGETITGAEAMAMTAFKAALKGDWKAYELVNNLLGGAKSTSGLQEAAEQSQREKEKREKAEIRRLNKLYETLPDNKKKLVAGLIKEAARIKISLDDLWEDIKLNGNIETFAQGKDEFTRERPNSKIYTARAKLYKDIIRQLDEWLPEQSTGGKLEELFKDE